MSDTGPARLPGLHRLMTTDTSLSTWADRVNEHLEVRSGARGNDLERSATQRDIKMLLDKIAALERKIPTTTVVDSETGTTVTTTVTATPTSAAKDYAPEIAALKAKNDALQRRIIQLEARPMSGVGYGSAFELIDVVANGVPIKQWRIKADIGWDRGTGTNTFGASFDALRWAHYTSESRELLNGAPALNPNMLVRGIDNIDMGGVADAARTLPPRVTAIENRFDGAGRLAWGHLPSYTTSFFRDASGNLLTVNLDLFCWSVEENISKIRAHLGI